MSFFSVGESRRAHPGPSRVPVARPAHCGGGGCNNAAELAAEPPLGVAGGPPRDLSAFPRGFESGPGLPALVVPGSAYPRGSIIGLRRPSAQVLDLTPPPR